MGLFDFLKKKNTKTEESKFNGIEESKFNSLQFQNEVSALALWKLEENNGKSDTAIFELRKIGLNERQIEFIIKRVNKVVQSDTQNTLNQKGIDDSTFNSDSFQKGILDNSIDLYFKNGHSYEIVEQKLLKDGLNANQKNDILLKLKARIGGMVDDFQEQLDSGSISEIKIKPNVEHVKGNVDSEQVDKYIAYGAFQMDRGDLENALELFDKAIELDENATLAYANKGTLYSKKAENEKALLFYNKALAIEPNHIQILENKMDLLFEIMNEKNEKEFIETAKTILKNEPIHPNALIYVIQNYLKENDIENALKSVKLLFKNYHSENISTQLLLDIFHKLPNDKALEEFINFTDEINENAQYQLQYCKGLYLMGIKDYENSIATFDNLNKKEEFSWNYYQIAIIKNYQNKTDECLDFLRKTFELEPELKEDAKRIPFFQNLSANSKFLELTK